MSAHAYDWQDSANCAGVDAEVFFPPVGSPGKEARAICARCEVSSECLTAALADRSLTGIWGGTSEMERRLLSSLRCRLCGAERQPRHTYCDGCRAEVRAASKATYDRNRNRTT